MPFVLTVDQIKSRGQQDLVEATLAGLGEVDTLLPFTRTVGDEFQGLVANPASVVDVTLGLMRTVGWHIGIGIGAVPSISRCPQCRRSSQEAVDPCQCPL